MPPANISAAQETKNEMSAVGTYPSTVNMVYLQVQFDTPKVLICISDSYAFIQLCFRL